MNICVVAKSPGLLLRAYSGKDAIYVLLLEMLPSRNIDLFCYLFITTGYLAAYCTLFKGFFGTAKTICQTSATRPPKRVGR